VFARNYVISAREARRSVARSDPLRSERVRAHVRVLTIADELTIADDTVLEFHRDVTRSRFHVRDEPRDAQPMTRLSKGGARSNAADRFVMRGRDSFILSP
jgi:hypothetical protein